MLRNFLKALINRSNISSNIAKMPCWMKSWIRLTERKNSKQRKNHVRWIKIVLDENLIASKLFIQHFQAHPTKFSCWVVYSLFHPTFNSYDVNWNVRTSNFERFNKTKALCKLIKIKKNHTHQIEIGLSNSKEDYDRLSKLQG